MRRHNDSRDHPRINGDHEDPRLLSRFTITKGPTSMGLFSSFKKAFSFSFNVREDARPLSAAEARGLALGGVYSAEGYLPVNALTLEADPTTAARLLAGPWEVSGPSDVTEVVERLLSGLHDHYFRLLNPELTQLAFARSKRSDYQDALSSLKANGGQQGLDGETLETYFTGWSMAHQSGVLAELPDPLPSSIYGWDIARLVHVSRLAFDAQYISEDEAFAHIARAVESSRPAFASWAEFGDSFITGRAFWASQDVRQPIDPDIHDFQDAIKNLHKTEGSPWLTLSW